MGEKFFAQRILMLLRSTVGKNSREAEAALGWAQDDRDWLWPDRDWSADTGEVTIGWDSIGDLAREIDPNEPELPMLASLDAISSLLKLGDFDRSLLAATAALQRLPRLSILRARLLQAGLDGVRLTGQVAGAPSAEADSQVRRSQALALGLLCIDRDYSGAELQLQWSLARLLDERCVDEQAIIDSLAGIRQQAVLSAADFPEQERDLDLLKRLLRTAVQSGARGVNVLIYGPPGTGKTEFARTLAEAAGARLYAVGESDDDGDEPTRAERLYALNRAQRLLARRKDSLLLFDELEDLFAEAAAAANGQRRSGSKIFVNRLLEQVAVPVIWTSNSLDAVDPAHLRRLSYVLRMGYPSAAARARVAARAAQAVGAVPAVAGLGQLLASEAESSTIAGVALRTAALAGGGPKDAEAAGRSLLQALRGGRQLPASHKDGSLDLALYRSEPCVRTMVGRLTSAGAPLDVSLLLSGPPGTGKTALAADIARRLDRPLAVRRASDLLSKWVGETEANIAEAFAAARDSGSVLLFDEADSLLLDRGQARQSWEVTQVNELLTWMDSHALPFIAATNFASRLDPAVFRRFVFKLELQPLAGEALDRAFERFFGSRAPRSLQQIALLTPGDFAVVQRQLRYLGDRSPEGIVELLEREAAAKPGAPAKLGF